MTQIATEPIIGPEGEAAEVGGAPSERVTGRSPWQLFWRRFRRDRLAFVGIVVIILMTILALLAPVISNWIGHGPNEAFTREALTEGLVPLPIGPDFEKKFFFGADTAGSDVFVRVLYGARTSLMIAFFATGLSVLIGVAVGLSAEYYGGKIDTVLSRTTEVVMAMPILLLAVGLASACGATREGCLFGALRPGLLLVSLIIGLFNWPYIARLVRGQVLTLREKEFVEAARAQGAGNGWIMRRHILPNVLAPIIVYTTLVIPNNIIFEAALSFLGAGVPAETPSWGRMLSEAGGRQSFVSWWMMVFPGLFLLMTTLAFNLVGDGLRDALDPKTAS